MHTIDGVRRASASANAPTAFLLVILGGIAPAALLGCATDFAHPFRTIDTIDAGGGSDGGASDMGSAPDINIGPCPVTLIGFATLDGGTTGGGDAAPSTATTVDELRTLAAQTVPAVIRISGTLTLDAHVEVESNKTIVAAKPGDGLVGNGLFIKDKRNVIVRNLTIAKALHPDDAIGIQSSANIWVDHCDLSSDLTSPDMTYDGLVDVTHASDAVTISWTRFHDHINTSLIGHSADNAAQDTGHLTVTYHHNLFLNTPSGSPRARFGHVHIFGNYYLTVPHDNLPVDNLYGIASASGATALIEHNVFDLPMGSPIVTHWVDTNPDGTVWDLSNLYIPLDRQGANVITTPQNNWRPPYVYSIDQNDFVQLIVTTCAGVGKVP
jgi:pectate lyase